MMTYNVPLHPCCSVVADVCDAAAQYAEGNAAGDLCPVNTTTNVGVCPDVWAGGVASTALCSVGGEAS